MRLPAAARALAERRARRAEAAEHIPRYDPGRERRAERRARELMRTVVSAQDYEMYLELGFLNVEGRSGRGGYAYLIYPHRPIVAYSTENGELLNEYCVVFTDPAGSERGERLPAADDVLAKWMSLRGSERELIDASNMHLPGRQVDIGQVRRDLLRLREWRAVRARTVAPA